jgi:hypothetical protein
MIGANGGKYPVGVGHPTKDGCGLFPKVDGSSLVQGTWGKDATGTVTSVGACCPAMFESQIDKKNRMGCARAWSGHDV